MREQVTTETAALQEIEELELRLHRLYAARDRAPADEKSVVEAKIQETRLAIEQLRADLHS